MNTLKPCLLAALFTGCMQFGFAQVEITPAILNAAGASVSKNVSLEWSLGEMTTVSTTSSRQLQVSAGVLQGQPWMPVRDNTTERPVIYPNPLVRTGYLRYEQALRGAIQCELTDASGKLLRTWTFSHSGGKATYVLPMQDVAAGQLYCIIRFTPQAGVSVTNTDILKIVRQ